MTKESHGPLRSLKQHNKIVQNAIRKSFMEHRTEIRNESTSMMNAQKSGREYLVYRSKRGQKLRRPRRHVASAKGEPMANMTGDTLRSLAFKVIGYRRLMFGWGTIQGAVWEAKDMRDVLQRARVKNHQKLVSAFNRNIFNGIRNAAKAGVM
jgi:hypothetical protein